MPRSIALQGKPLRRWPSGLEDQASRCAIETDPTPRAEVASGLGFGPHLVFDAYECPARRLSDVGALYRLLDDLPARIGMSKIMPPYVFRHLAQGGLAEGLSGFVLIAESHASVHTFPARGYVNVDIFSCESFDVEDALSVLRQEFLPRRVEWKLLDRGCEFPKHLARSRAIVARDRSVLARGSRLEASR